MGRRKKKVATFTNATMFALVMQDEKLCVEFVERALGRKVENLRIANKIDVSTEETIIAGLRSKSIRMDVRFTDEKEWYCIEMQVDTEEDLAKRSCYYHSVMAVKDMKPGDDYSKLKPSYVIFLCCFDPAGAGKARYEYEMYDKRNGLSLGEKRYTIYLNSKALEVPEELKGLFAYINDRKLTEGDSFLTAIDEIVTRYNEDGVGESIMNIEQHYSNKVKRAKAERDEEKAARIEAEAAKAALEKKIKESDAKLAEMVEAGEISDDTARKLGYTG